MSATTRRGLFGLFAGAAAAIGVKQSAPTPSVIEPAADLIAYDLIAPAKNLWRILPSPWFGPENSLR